MNGSLETIVDFGRCPLSDERFQSECRAQLNEHGVLVLRDFLKPSAIAAIRAEGNRQRHLAYYTASQHNIYLTHSDDSLNRAHPRNRLVSSSKGCITDDQVSRASALRKLYDAASFRDFLRAVLGEKQLFGYADSLSSINLHYASEGQELGWHFDNSSFAITLMIQAPKDGGRFEYVKDVRDADAGEMNYPAVAKVLDGEVEPQALSMEPGALVLFRGRNSMHRVTPTIGDRTRMLVVLAYNTEPDVALSESARMTFYGRLE
ncbi:MAG: 2OG-Fe(II) oxygenase [Woeseiaceae bacterium]